jgi:uncharacterized protein YnzC (UPF0291/DUF896 family)
VAAKLHNKKLAALQQEKKREQADLACEYITHVYSNVLHKLHLTILNRWQRCWH